MQLTRQVILNESRRIVAFYGGPQRTVLMRRLGEEYVRLGRKVVLSGSTSRYIPPRGQIAVGSDPALLANQIIRMQNTHLLVVAASSIGDAGAQGFSLETLARLVKLLPESVFLLDLGEADPEKPLAAAQVSQWKCHSLWDQLVFCLDAGELAILLEAGNREYLSALQNGSTADRAAFSQQLLLRYLRSEQNDAVSLFEQAWPVVLFIDAVDQLSRENRFLQLGKDLIGNGIHHVVLADLKSGFLKKVS